MPEPIDDLIRLLAPILGEPGGTPEALMGGITNRNFKMRLGEADYVVRVTSPESEYLAIDRTAEHEASRAAAQVGVGPEVAAFLPQHGCLVTNFIPGRPLPPEELRAATALSQVAAAVRAFHEGPVIPSRFSPFRVVQSYAETAERHGATIPRDYGEALRIGSQIESALHGPEHAPVPCHNDLLNANMIHDGSRVWLVDWEYAGMGDRYFDLGNLSINNGFTEADDERLLLAYFGGPDPGGRFAGLRLMRIMSDFREAMWGVVQSVVSPLDFDYPSYSVRHFERLRASAADPCYRDWLEAAGASHV
ncbi:MAG: phosphotransferase [Gemmatimonadales bacterium]